MNIKETNKIAKWLESIGYTTKRNSILWFGSLQYTGLREYKNKNKDNITIINDWFLWFEAGINKAGVGDDQKPDKAITYSLGCCLHANIKPYKHKNDYNDEVVKFYAYDRTLEGLKIKFYKYLTSRSL